MASNLSSDRNNSNFRLITYNLHGLNQGCVTLDYICKTISPDIVFIQEHWKSSSDLLDILHFSDKYSGFGCSAMDDTLSKGVLIGRPYGGVCILVSKKLSRSVDILLISERAVIVRINNCAFINVYLPCKKASSIILLDSIFSEISSVVAKHPDVEFIFGGDINCNIHETCPFSRVISEFLLRHDFISVDKDFLDIKNAYTYQHASLDNRSYVDFIFVQSTSKSVVLDYKIVEFPLNISDHLPVMINMNLDNKLLIISESLNSDNNGALDSINNRLRWDHADLQNYYFQCFLDFENLMLELDVWLKSFNSESFFCLFCASHSAHICSRHLGRKEKSRQMINQLYERSVACLQNAAVKYVNATPPNVYKHWWDKVASDYKLVALSDFKKWVSEGKPISGIFFNQMKTSKKAYKLHLLSLKKAEKDKISEKLLQSFTNYNKRQDFWKVWKCKFGSTKNSSHINIDGLTDDSKIANVFADNIVKNCSPNSTLKNNKNKNIFLSRREQYNTRNKVHTDINVCMVDNIISKLKRNKSPGPDGLTAEHLLYAHPSVIVFFSRLLNAMLTYEIVPKHFGHSITVFIPKGSGGRCSNSSDDYRGISIYPILAKVYERCLLNIFSTYLKTDKLQFGFKNDSGCSDALYTVHQTINYFTDRKNNVMLCSLDLRKAFDKVDCYVIFDKLMNRHCPANFINVLDDWYSQSSTTVKWRSKLSKSVSLSSGVRQGSILAPYLFAIYVDDLLKELSRSKLGCTIKNLSVCAIMYADDLVLLSTCLLDLQKMIELCLVQFDNLDMLINETKSCCIKIGDRFNITPAKLNVNGCNLPWVNSLKFLGHNFISGKTLKCDFHLMKSKFFGSVNSILGKIGTNTSLNVSLSLVFSKCIPILMYGLESLSLTSKEIQSFSYTYNSIFFKLFKTFDKDIIANCQYHCGYLTFPHNYMLRRFNFLRNAIDRQDSVSNFLLTNVGYCDYANIVNNYSIVVNDGRRQAVSKIWKTFAESLAFRCF